jgi:AcrR family transcriptional regulator
MPLRADAARNRQALLAAAREMFAEHGLDVPIDQIARRADIGNATLYRNFPTRADLVSAVFQEQMAAHYEAVQAALQDPDPWHGLCSYLKAAAVMQTADRAIADLVTMELSAAPEIEILRTGAFHGLVVLLERAKEQGTLRLDCSAEDVLVFLMANAGLVERTGRSANDASARLVHLLTDGLQSTAATSGPASPSPRRMRLVMRDLATRLRLRSAAT